MEKDDDICGIKDNMKNVRDEFDALIADCKEMRKEFREVAKKGEKIKIANLAMEQDYLKDKRSL